MTQSPQEHSARNHTSPGPAQDRWLDVLWSELFAAGDGLTSPRQIRTEGLSRERVRAAERASLEATELETNQLRSGRMLRDVSGQMVDTAAAGELPMFAFIERSPSDDDQLFARVSRPQQVLRSVVDSVTQQSLLHSINLRRLALLAEAEIYAQPMPPRSVATQRPEREWMQRWRQLAEQVFSTELQVLWARVLVLEIAVPGRYSLSILDFLARISERDLAGIRVLAGCSFRDFIFDARTGYFESALHGPLLKAASDTGLLRGDGKRCWLKLHSRPLEMKPQLLICNNRAVQLQQVPDSGLQLPVIRVTDLGKQIFRLCNVHADMAYLLDLAHYLRTSGAQVNLGDWEPRTRHFEKRFDVT